MFFVNLSRKVDISMFPTFEKIKELADRQGISINKLEENLGYSRNTIYNLKTKNQTLNESLRLPIILMSVQITFLVERIILKSLIPLLVKKK